MKTPARIARWIRRNRQSVFELALPRQVTPTWSPGDPAHSMTVLLLAPTGIQSAEMTAAILDLGVGRVLRISSISKLRHVEHEPVPGDVAVVCGTQRLTSRRRLRLLNRAGWSDVIINHGGAEAADLLDLPERHHHRPPIQHRPDNLGESMASEERIEQIDSGIDKIRTEKPYSNHADAIAALDWLASASSDMHKALNASDDTAAIAGLQDRIETLDRLHSSVVATMKRTDKKVPERHLEPTTTEVES